MVEGDRLVCEGDGMVCEGEGCRMKVMKRCEKVMMGGL